MTINDSTISTNVWDDVKSTLVASSLTVGTTSVSIKAAFNDKSLSRPQVVIYPIEVSESTFKFGGKYGKRFIDVIVECYTGTSADLDNLADQVKESIRDALADESLSGMDLVGIEENYSQGTLNRQKLHVKTITFAFDRE